MTAVIIDFKTKIRKPDTEAECSFCGRPKSVVKSLVANADNSRHICDQCTIHFVALVSQSNQSSE